MDKVKTRMGRLEVRSGLGKEKEEKARNDQKLQIKINSEKPKLGQWLYMDPDFGSILTEDDVSDDECKYKDCQKRQG